MGFLVIDLLIEFQMYNVRTCIMRLNFHLCRVLEAYIGYQCAVTLRHSQSMTTTTATKNSQIVIENELIMLHIIFMRTYMLRVCEQKTHKKYTRAYTVLQILSLKIPSIQIKCSSNQIYYKIF